LRWRHRRSRRVGAQITQRSLETCAVDDGDVSGGDGKADDVAADEVADDEGSEAAGGAASGLMPPRVVARNASPARPPPGREASRARWAASDSTLRTASSSDSRSRVISDSLKGGCTLRNCPISAARARSYSARRLSPGALGSSPAMARAISG